VYSIETCNNEHSMNRACVLARAGLMEYKERCMDLNQVNPCLHT
jgi:hypothetical protein